MLKQAVFAFFCVMLTACQSLPMVKHLPHQVVDLRIFKLEQLTPLSQQSLLTVQFEPNQWRWIQTDPLGAPLARLILSEKGWQNDGFITPNRQAQWLFSAIAVQLNPSEPPFAVEKRGNEYLLNHNIVWQTEPQQQGFRIKLADRSEWQIEPLE